jgi:hypothetical protein
MNVFQIFLIIVIIILFIIIKHYKKPFHEKFDNMAKEVWYDKPEGKCTNDELELFNKTCQELESPLAKRMSPIVKQMSAMQTSFQRISALDANEASMSIFAYINKNQKDINNIAKVMNKFKCLFFTCDSEFKKPIDDLTEILNNPPVLFQSREGDSLTQLATSVKPRKPSVPSAQEADAAFQKILIYISRTESPSDIGKFIDFIKKHFMHKNAKYNTQINFKTISENYISLFQ